VHPICSPLYKLSAYTTGILMNVRLHWICGGAVGSQSILRADCQTETPIVRYSNYRFIDLPQILVMRHSKSGTRTSCSTARIYIPCSHISENYRQRLIKYDTHECICKACTAMCVFCWFCTEILCSLRTVQWVHVCYKLSLFPTDSTVGASML
jgi:hypothetical protein